LIASPSGSDAATVNVISVCSAPLAVPGAVTTGARFTFVTVIDVDADPASAFAAVKLTGYADPPPSEKVGVHVNVPDVCASFEAKAPSLPAGKLARSAVSEAIASPSGSDADTVNVISVCSAPLAVPGAVTTSARSTFVTVIDVDADPASAFAAVKLTGYADPPPSAYVGVHVNVPNVCAPFTENAALFPTCNHDMSAVSELIACPSGSDADTVKLIDDASPPLAVAGAVTTGGRSSVTVMAVEAVPDSAFDAVKDTL